MKFAETQGQSFEQKFLVGPITVNNILINPTLKELKEWGIDYLQNEPVYTGEQEGIKYVDLVFWAKWIDDPNLTKNWKIRLKAQHMSSSTGKLKYINYKGVTSWVADEADLQPWFTSGEYRKCLVGEEQFVSFMVAFNNILLGKLEAGESVLETTSSLEKLFKGDFSELEPIKTNPKFKDFKLQIPVGLVASDSTDKEGNAVTKFYDRVYTDKFFYHWETEPYLYESKEKKGKVSWEEYLDYLVKVNTGNWNPDIYKAIPTIMTLNEVKAELENKNSNNNTSNTNSGSPVDDLPF